MAGCCPWRSWRSPCKGSRPKTAAPMTSVVGIDLDFEFAVRQSEQTLLQSLWVDFVFGAVHVICDAAEDVGNVTLRQAMLVEVELDTSQANADVEIHRHLLCAAAHRGTAGRLRRAGRSPAEFTARRSSRTARLALRQPHRCTACR